VRYPDEDKVIHDLSQIDEPLSPEVETLDRARFAEMGDERFHRPAGTGDESRDHFDCHFAFGGNTGDECPAAIDNERSLQPGILRKPPQKVICTICDLCADIEGYGSREVARVLF
jgi:hypothetical protein